jgi:hypothetical protein
LWWNGAAGEGADAVALGQGPAHGAGHGVGGAADVEGFGAAADDDRDDLGVAGPAAGVFGGDRAGGRAVGEVEQSVAEPVFEHGEGDGDGEVRAFPCLGGQVSAVQGAVGEVDEAVGVAFGVGAGVGVQVGDAAFGQLA